MMKALLKEALEKMKITYDSSHIGKIIAFQELLLDANRSINLIGPTGSGSIIKRHILDSLAPLSCGIGSGWNDTGIKILDIGSGGGFPGIPLGIFLDRAEIVLLEKSRKKSDFLLKAIRLLSLDNVSVLTGRAEELAREEKWREAFQVIVARAVTNINILLELSIPFCIINGKIIFYKSKKVFGEIKTSDNAVKTLGGRIGDLIEVEIPGLEEYRALLVINKVENTPNIFPRNFSRIKKKPL